MDNNDNKISEHNERWSAILEQRAKRLAVPQKVFTNDGCDLWVKFTIHHNTFAIAHSLVNCVCKHLHCTPVDLHNGRITGLTSINGDIVSITNLYRWLEFEAPEEQVKLENLIVLKHRELEFALSGNVTEAFSTPSNFLQTGTKNSELKQQNLILAKKNNIWFINGELLFDKFRKTIRDK